MGSREARSARRSRSGTRRRSTAAASSVAPPVDAHHRHRQRRGGDGEAQAPQRRRHVGRRRERACVSHPLAGTVNGGYPVLDSVAVDAGRDVVCGGSLSGTLTFGSDGGHDAGDRCLRRQGFPGVHAKRPLHPGVPLKRTIVTSAKSRCELGDDHLNRVDALDWRAGRRVARRGRSGRGLRRRARKARARRQDPLHEGDSLKECACRRAARAPPRAFPGARSASRSQAPWYASELRGPRATRSRRRRLEQWWDERNQGSPHAAVKHAASGCEFHPVAGLRRERGRHLNVPVAQARVPQLASFSRGR